MGDQRLTGMTANQKQFLVAAPLKPFRRRGECGRWMSDLVSHTGDVSDKLAMLKAVHTESINHDPGVTFLSTGDQSTGKPSVGAWVSYGLGSENSDLPSFMVMISQGTGKDPGQPIFSRLWGAGFLPSRYQGVRLRSGSNPVLHLSDPAGIDRSTRRRLLDDIAAINRSHYERMGDREIQARIAQYEMAYRMQASVPELTDMSDEPEHMFELYGPDARKPGTYAANCMLARRMAERGVRFIQLFHRGWDQHKKLQKDLSAQCRDTDQPSAALIKDLDQRGLLEDTLVVWAGEFGRTTYSQGKLGHGRDHHGRCFSLWMAGGGIKGGVDHGQTDAFGYNVVSGGVHLNDLHATILYCLGIDHNRFTFPFQGLDQRLTGVEARSPVHEVLA